MRGLPCPNPTPQRQPRRWHQHVGHPWQPGDRRSDAMLSIASHHCTRITRNKLLLINLVLCEGFEIKCPCGCRRRFDGTRQCTGNQHVPSRSCHEVLFSAEAGNGRYFCFLPPAPALLNTCHLPGLDNSYHGWCGCNPCPSYQACEGWSLLMCELGQVMRLSAMLSLQSAFLPRGLLQRLLLEKKHDPQLSKLATPVQWSRKQIVQPCW